jgi:hypothetical protein
MSLMAEKKKKSRTVNPYWKITIECYDRETMESLFERLRVGRDPYFTGSPTIDEERGGSGPVREQWNDSLVGYWEIRKTTEAPERFW